jgi:hypothetical protein
MKKNLYLWGTLVALTAITAGYFLYQTEPVRKSDQAETPISAAIQAELDTSRELQTPMPETQATPQKMSQTDALESNGRASAEANWLSTLKAKAQSGDVDSTCRYASALQQCVEAERLIGAAESYLQFTQSKAPERMKDESDERFKQRIEFMQSSLKQHQDALPRLAQLKLACTQLEPNAHFEYPTWLLKSALQGHPYAIGKFITEEGYLMRAALERPDLVATYRTHAPLLLRQYETQPYANTNFLKNLYARKSSSRWLEQLVPADASKAYLFASIQTLEIETTMAKFPARSIHFDSMYKNSISALLDAEKPLSKDQIALQKQRAKAHVELSTAWRETQRKLRAQTITPLTGWSDFMKRVEHSCDGPMPAVF